MSVQRRTARMSSRRAGRPRSRATTDRDTTPSPTCCARRRSAAGLMLVAAVARAALGQPGRILLRSRARPAPRPAEPAALGRRRPAHDLLLRRRARAQTRADRSARCADPAEAAGADRRGGLRHGRAGACSTCSSTAGGRRPARRLGHPDGDRHRVRARRSWRSPRRRCRAACGHSCSPWRSSTTSARSLSSRLVFTDERRGALAGRRAAVAAALVAAAAQPDHAAGRCYLPLGWRGLAVHLAERRAPHHRWRRRSVC